MDPVKGPSRPELVRVLPCRASLFENPVDEALDERPSRSTLFSFPDMISRFEPAFEASIPPLFDPFRSRSIRMILSLRILSIKDRGEERKEKTPAPFEAGVKVFKFIPSDGRACATCKASDAGKGGSATGGTTHADIGVVGEDPARAYQDLGGNRTTTSHHLAG